MPLSWTQLFAENAPLGSYPELIDDKHIPLLRVAIWVLLGGSVVFMAILLTYPPEHQWRIYSCAGLMTLAATAHAVLRYRGAVATLRLLAIGSWILATTVSFLGEGVRTPILLAYPIILIFGGWLLGTRFCLRMFVASSVAVIALAISQQTGLLSAAKPAPPLMVAMVFLIILTISAVLTLYLLRLFRDRYAEEHRLNSEIRQLNLGLEQRVAQRTAELEKAKDAALAADRAKSDFLASMSHEIRTPLNAILGFSQLIGLSPDLPEETRDNAQEIGRAGQHLLVLINEVLDLARIEAKQLGLTFKPVLVKSLLADCLGMIRPIADKHGIELINQARAGEASVVRADYVRLRQIVINLLTNAIKYNRPKGRVSLSSETIGDKVRISVLDSGPGIPADKQAHLFQAFDRIGKEAGTVEGTGIGLVISKRLVEAMGGSIGFQSIQGQGSTFWVELPVSDTQEIPLSVVSASPPEPGQVNQPTVRRVVLYVEDNPASLRLMQKIIANWPEMELRGASTAEIGIEMARTDPPALILMDINLPGMNGYEALVQLKTDPITAHIPVMALTANAMNSEQEKALAAGFCAFITKPLNLASLYDTLRHALDVPVV